MVATDDMQALRDYVMAPATGSQQQAESTVVLHVTHNNLKLQMMELRFDLHVRSPGPVLEKAFRWLFGNMRQPGSCQQIQASYNCLVSRRLSKVSRKS